MRFPGSRESLAVRSVAGSERFQRTGNWKEGGSESRAVAGRRRSPKTRRCYRILNIWWNQATRGDPMRLLLWTSKSLRHLEEALQDLGHSVLPACDCRPACGNAGYSLQANSKTQEGGGHMDRDAQFQSHRRSGQVSFWRRMSR